MMNSPTTTMNVDVILEILSYCSATEIGKFRLLNKECNKRSYELSFINRHLHRTNSVFGYLIQQDSQWFDSFRYRFCFVSAVKEEEKERISLNFLHTYNAHIEACDRHHGILLCVDKEKFLGMNIKHDYIVCKPATKQYRIIPNPRTRYFSIASGLMVISSNPFRYKIIRVSGPKTGVEKEGFYNHKCEVFDSDSFAWKQLNDLELSEFFPKEAKPVSAYGCLHWLTRMNNVIRFCMRTETWSIFPIPDELLDDTYLLTLVSYGGKLGVLQSRSRETTELWVLEKSFGKSWVNLKDAKITASEDIYEQPVWFPSNDVVAIAGFDRLGLYDIGTKKYFYLPTEEDFNASTKNHFVPFYSNYDTVALDKNDVEGAIYEEEMGR